MNDNIIIINHSLFLIVIMIIFKFNIFIEILVDIINNTFIIIDNILVDIIFIIGINIIIILIVIIIIILIRLIELIGLFDSDEYNLLVIISISTIILLLIK